MKKQRKNFKFKEKKLNNIIWNEGTKYIKIEKG